MLNRNLKIFIISFYTFISTSLLLSINQENNRPFAFILNQKIKEHEVKNSCVKRSRNESNIPLDILFDNTVIYQDFLSVFYEKLFTFLLSQNIMDAFFNFVNIKKNNIKSIIASISIVSPFEAQDIVNLEDDTNQEEVNLTISLQNILIKTLDGSSITITQDTLQEFLLNTDISSYTLDNDALFFLLRNVIENDPIFVVFPEFILEVMMKQNIPSLNASVQVNMHDLETLIAISSSAL